MLVVQIKGGNGSGKTTIVKQLLELCEEVEYLYKDGKCLATVMDDVGWLALGEYNLEKVVGGTDRFRTIESVKIILNTMTEYGLEHELFGLVFEGMLISTIKSTFYAHLLWMEKYYGVKPLFVILETTLHGCIHRLAERGTIRPDIKLHKIATKSSSVVYHALEYDQQYVRWIDVEHTQLGDMLSVFLNLVGDVELLESICEV